MCSAAVRSGDVSARRAAGNATICKWHCVPAPPVTSRSILWTQPYFRVNHLLTSAGRTQPPPSKAPTETHADAGGGGDKALNMHTSLFRYQLSSSVPRKDENFSKSYGTWAKKLKRKFAVVSIKSLTRAKPPPSPPSLFFLPTSPPYTKTLQRVVASLCLVQTNTLMDWHLLGAGSGSIQRVRCKRGST